MKTLLHMCALSAIRCDPDIGNYYKRQMSGEGKPKLVVINAVRYKLISRIFACVEKNSLYQPKREIVEDMAADDQHNCKANNL